MIGKCLLDKDPRIEIEPEDFSGEADSTILVRERVRGTKLEGAFKNVKGNIVNETENTLEILPETGKCYTLSKRDVARTPKETKQNKKKAKTGTTKKANEMPNYEKLRNAKNLPNVDKSGNKSWQ